MAHLNILIYCDMAQAVIGLHGVEDHENSTEDHEHALCKKGWLERDKFPKVEWLYALQKSLQRKQKQCPVKFVHNQTFFSWFK